MSGHMTVSGHRAGSAPAPDVRSGPTVVRPWIMRFPRSGPATPELSRIEDAATSGCVRPLSRETAPVKRVPFAFGRETLPCTRGSRPQPGQSLAKGSDNTAAARSADGGPSPRADDADRGPVRRRHGRTRPAVRDHRCGGLRGERRWSGFPSRWQADPGGQQVRALPGTAPRRPGPARFPRGHGVHPAGGDLARPYRRHRRRPDGLPDRPPCRAR